MGVKPLIIAARYKWLLLVPFIIIVPVAAALSFRNIKSEFVSRATLWSDDAVFLDSVLSSNPYNSPAQNRASDLNELLSTESFRAAVASRIGMPDTAVSRQAIRSGTGAYANGRHSMVVAHTGPDPAEAQRIINGVINEFREQYAENAKQMAANARPIYEQQLLTDQAALDSANAEYTAYVQSARLAPGPGPADPKAAELLAAVQRAQASLNDTIARLQEIDRLTTSTEASLQRTLRVIDPPTLPDAPLGLNKRELVMLPAAGLLLALSISAAMYTFFLKTDNNVRVADDLAALPGLMLLGTIPDMTPVKQRRWPDNFFRIAAAALGIAPVK